MLGLGSYKYSICNIKIVPTCFYVTKTQSFYKIWEPQWEPLWVILFYLGTILTPLYLRFKRGVSGHSSVLPAIGRSPQSPVGWTGQLGVPIYGIYKMLTVNAPFKKRKYLSKKNFKANVRARSTFSKVPLYRSMRPSGVHTITKSVNLGMNSTSSGYTFNIGVASSQFFTIWFDNQAAWIWRDAFNYSIAQIPGYTDLSALFDEIMLAQVDIKMYTGTDATTSNQGSAQIIMAADYNDKVPPTAIGDVLQYSDCRTWNCSNNFVNKRSIKPKFLTYSQDASGAPLATTPKRGFIRSTSQIEHFGLKCGFINNSPNNQNHIYMFKFTYLCKIAK